MFSKTRQKGNVEDLSRLSHGVLYTQIMFIQDVLFFYQGFLSQTLTIHRTAGEGRGLSLIPLCHFHPLTNIEIFICNFACEMTIAYFYRNACVYQTANRWDLPPYRITIWVIDWWCNICLFTWWIDSRFFITAIWHEKPVDLNSHRLSPLYYKRIDKPSVDQWTDNQSS